MSKIIVWGGDIVKIRLVCVNSIELSLRVEFQGRICLDLIGLVWTRYVGCLFSVLFFVCQI